MNLFHLVHFQYVLKALNYIDLSRGGLHQHRHAITEDRDGCKDADNCKDKCTNRVCNLGLRSEKDDDCCDNYTNTLNDVSDNMNHCSSDVHVLMIMPIMAMSMPMAVTVTVIVPVRMSMFMFVFMLVLMLTSLPMFVFMIMMML